MSKTLVAFFSASGVTAALARKIAADAMADLFEIKPAMPYTAADLDWNDKGSRTTLEQKDEKCRPGIADKVSDMAEYGTIFLGFPIWWYVEPMIIRTFLESYDFSGKNIFVFATSGSSGLGNIMTRLKEGYPDARWQDGKRFAANASDAEVAAWVNESLGWKK